MGASAQSGLFEAPAHAIELDPEQARAVESTAPGTVVRAGAGTGKTRTIMARINRLVSVLGVPPGAITVATFTNKAAGEIRQRLAGQMGADVAAAVQMGTFHSLGARLLRRHAARAGLPRNFVVLDDDDARRVLREAVLGGGHARDDDGLAAELDAAFRAIRRWKTWGLSVTKIEDPDRLRRDAGEERLARVYVSYQHELQRRGMVDFGDLVMLPVELMDGHPDVADEESERVMHLLVDEAQDANPVQVLFARRLARRHANVFAVGDEDQSIFSFQGGYPEAIRQIAGAGALDVTLVTNRRCTDQILAPAVALVSRNRRPSPKVLRSGRSGPVPALTVASSDHDEADRAVRKVKEFIAAGAPPAEVAILARSGFAFSAAEEALLKAGIPYEVTGGTPLVEREEVRDVVAYLRLALDPTEAMAFERIANRPLRGLGPQAVEAVLARQKDSGAPFYEACGNVGALGGVRLTGAHREGLASLSRALAGLDAACRDDKPSSDIMAMVLEDTGVGYGAFVAASKDKGRRRRLDNIESMRRIAAEEPDIWECMQRIVLAGEDEVVVPGSRVRVSTMHSSKGLEWDHVICVGMDSAVIPSPRALESGSGGTPGDPWDGPKGGGIEEERRLAHVAFTRARKTLDVMAPLSRNGKRTEPSEFLPDAGMDPYEDFDPFAHSAPRPGRKGFGTRAGRKGFDRKG